ncbi:hypothetical protein CTI12_AA098680 [Artemisia annua]|uniref:Integrase catalytic domain-containing protein n=1 Tax=Artemisia annua TaxID=35608 RepID=A0A2U1PY29_ARTAN|nr:hypothetical protein CTI12_AA098680 [Artemisia annua]
MTEPAVFQNPLYLHPSDGPGSLTVQEKLNGAQNYRAWHRAIEIGLSTKGKLGFVRGTIARSTTDANLVELWDTCNNMVICWLIGSVNESIAKSIMFIGTSSEIWTQLEKRFALSDGSRRYKLNKDTYEITQSGGSISEYYTKMKCVWEELDSVNVLPVISVVSQEVSLFLSALSKQKEDQRLFQFLNGLDDQYTNQRSQILMIVPLPSVENACSMLQQEESQRQLFGSSSIESTALLSRGKFQEKCSICGFKWHPPERCWEKVGYPTWHPKYKVSKQFKPRDGQGRTQNAMGQKTVAHVESGNVSFTPQQFEQLLKSFQMKMVAEDDTEFANDFAAEDDQCVVSLYPEFCVVQDLATKKVTGLGRKKSGLYHLVNLPAEKVDRVFNSLVKTTLQKFSLSAVGSVNNSSYALWHHRLGHVSDSKLKHMNDLPVVVSKSHTADCLSCPMAKFTKLPYSLSESQSSEIFDLVHIDVWGPYKVPTNGKFRYFLTVVDDCSRATWTHLLVNKSDSFVALKDFLKFVSTQFGECGPDLKSQGIVHQTSCVDRPQQNGRVERKHTHILDTARALRFHSHLPLRFWGDCVTTATYLINRLPSLVLNNKTPYEILLKSKPDYSHLKVFGCFAVVSNPSRVPDKFAPRGVPCVFLGYPANQKGYKFSIYKTELILCQEMLPFMSIFSLLLQKFSTNYSEEVQNHFPLPNTNSDSTNDPQTESPSENSPVHSPTL